MVSAAGSDSVWSSSTQFSKPRIPDAEAGSLELLWALPADVGWRHLKIVLKWPVQFTTQSKCFTSRHPLYSTWNKCIHFTTWHTKKICQGSRFNIIHHFYCFTKGILKGSGQFFYLFIESTWRMPCLLVQLDATALICAKAPVVLTSTAFAPKVPTQLSLF